MMLLGSYKETAPVEFSLYAAYCNCSAVSLCRYILIRYADILVIGLYFAMQLELSLYCRNEYLQP